MVDVRRLLKKILDMDAKYTVAEINEGLESKKLYLLELDSVGRNQKDDIALGAVSKAAKTKHQKKLLKILRVVNRLHHPEHFQTVFILSDGKVAEQYIKDIVDICEE